jgi:hypothetical protein
MNKDNFFKWALYSLISGNTLIGYGIGRLFERCFEGAIIGLGLGMAIIAFILIRLIRRETAFEKK